MKKSFLSICSIKLLIYTISPIVFDDFDDGVIDSAKWTEIDVSADEIQENNGRLGFSKTSGGAWNKAVIANTSFPRSDLSFELDYQWIVNNSNYDALMLGWHDNGVGVSYTNLVMLYIMLGLVVPIQLM